MTNILQIWGSFWKIYFWLFTNSNKFFGKHAPQTYKNRFFDSPIMRKKFQTTCFWLLTHICDFIIWIWEFQKFICYHFVKYNTYSKNHNFNPIHRVFIKHNRFFYIFFQNDFFLYFSFKWRLAEYHWWIFDTTTTKCRKYATGLLVHFFGQHVSTCRTFFSTRKYV